MRPRPTSCSSPHPDPAPQQHLQRRRLVGRTPVLCRPVVYGEHFNGLQVDKPRQGDQSNRAIPPPSGIFTRRPFGSDNGASGILVRRSCRRCVLLLFGIEPDWLVPRPFAFSPLTLRRNAIRQRDDAAREARAPAHAGEQQKVGGKQSLCTDATPVAPYSRSYFLMRLTFAASHFRQGGRTCNRCCD